jgi:hypothetical protein
MENLIRKIAFSGLDGMGTAPVRDDLQREFSGLVHNMPMLQIPRCAKK